MPVLATATTLDQALRSITETTPDNLAVVNSAGGAWTYAELSALVNDVAHRLEPQIAPGSAVGVAVEDPVLFVATYLAIARTGAIAVLLDGSTSPSERKRVAERYALSGVVTDSGEARGRYRFEVAETRPGTDLSGYQENDFVVHFTSGSTGDPKGIVMSQHAILERARSWVQLTSMRASDVVLCALPLWHCHGIDLLTIPALLSGATVVFARGSELTGKGLARTIAEYSVTVISALPLMYQLLVDSKRTDPAQLASVRLAISGSAPLKVDTQTEFSRRYGVTLRQVYGLSEIGVITCDADGVGRGTIGHPIAGMKWRLEPTDVYDGDEQLCELYVQSPSLARGYYRDIGGSEMFVDGWLRTHDLISVQAGGWYIRGRRSTFINVAGNKVAPIEVESLLRERVGVNDCAVVGIPDGEGGERVVAAVVIDAGVDCGAVRRTAGLVLRSHQVPQEYRFVSALPRTRIGKTDYDAVRRMFASEENAV